MKQSCVAVATIFAATASSAETVNFDRKADSVTAFDDFSFGSTR